MTLTVEPKLQQAAWNALTSTPGNNDGAVVVLDPKTGAVLAMVSNPTFDPNALVSPSLTAEQLAYYSYIQKDHEGYYPLRPIATREFFFPGSTMKVVTSTAAYNLKPSLAGFNYPVQQCQKFSDSNEPLCDESGPCGGTMTQMLPFSCDPGYGELGVQEGVSTLRQQAELFGYQLGAPHRPARQSPSSLSAASQRSPRRTCARLAGLQAYTAIGQDVRAGRPRCRTPWWPPGIANGGVVMTPHLMSSIHDSQGALVQTLHPEGHGHGRRRPQAAQAVTSLMESVTQPSGTAAGVGFPVLPVCRGQDGDGPDGPRRQVNHDWMIGFAPANNPQIAVAVVVPDQNIGSDGASVAGPIMKAVHGGGAAAGLGQPALHRARRRRSRSSPRGTEPDRLPSVRPPPGVGAYTICVATQIVESPAGEEFRSAVGMLKLLGDETRLRVIWALLEGEHSVNELAEMVGAQPAAVSQHLAKLRLARLVRSRREGTRIFYVVDDAHVRRLVEEVLTHADHVTAHG